jgi:hypothetical protein
MKKFFAFFSIILIVAGCRTIENYYPVIYAPSYVACFDKIPAVFEFSISPYQPNLNKIEGKVMDMNGATVAKLQFQPIDQIEGLNATNPKLKGKQVWRATVGQLLAPGKYKIEIKHKINEISEMETADLEVFKTGIANQSEIDGLLTFLSAYGTNLKINVQPNSGGKIKSNQFRIYLNTDIDKQKPAFEGTQMDEPLELSAKANDVSLQVSWVQPFTNKEIDLFPKKNFPIRQKQPDISSRRQRPQVETEDGTKIKVVVSDIEIFYPIFATSNEKGDKKPEIKLSAKNGTINLKGGTWEWNSDPQVEQEVNENSIKCRITTDLAGSLEKGSDRIDGSISLQLAVTAINPINGKASDTKTELITVPVKITIDRAGSRIPANSGKHLKK